VKYQLSVAKTRRPRPLRHPRRADNAGVQPPSDRTSVDRKSNPSSPVTARPDRAVTSRIDPSRITPPPLSPVFVRRFACPVCHVGANQPCLMNDNVTPRKSNHQQRVDVAKARAM